MINGIRKQANAIQIAEDGLRKAHQSFEFYRHEQKYVLKDVMHLAY